MSLIARFICVLLFSAAALHCEAGLDMGTLSSRVKRLGSMRSHFSLFSGVIERGGRLLVSVPVGDISLHGLLVRIGPIRKYGREEALSRHLDQYEAVEYFLSGVHSLMIDSSVLSREWLVEVSREEYVDSVAVLRQGRIEYVGDPFEPQTFFMSSEAGFSIDEDGGLHYRLLSSRAGTYYDVLLHLDSLAGELDEGLLGRRTVFLYDSATGRRTTLIGGDADRIGELRLEETRRPLLVERGLFLVTSRFEDLSDNLYLVSLIPLLVGFRVYYVAGLIALAVFAIFLLISTAWYTARMVRRPRGAAAMEELMPDAKKSPGRETAGSEKPAGKEKSAVEEIDSIVIGEIDREISDIIDEDVEEKRPDVVDERFKKLKEDGIIIRK